MVSSWKQWTFVDRYRIPNVIKMLYSKDIVMSQYASEIKYIHAGMSSEIAWGLQTWGQQTPAQHSVQQVLDGNNRANSPIKNHAKFVA